MSTRTERDSMGEVAVPDDALYGAQTQRAVQNFPISGRTLPEGFVRALIALKRAAAEANGQLGELAEDKAAAIAAACDALAERDDLMRHFPVDVFQTGSGTSTNMNANEVIARLAADRSGLSVSPNDDVNRGQSSNDVIPSTIHIAAVVALERELRPALERLIAAIDAKAGAVGEHVKTGRTHLMDAMPVTFAQVLGGWSAQMRFCLDGIERAAQALHVLALGGTAVGTGVNAHPMLAERTAARLEQALGVPFRPADDRFALMGAQDRAVALSGALKTAAVALMKVANDLRWMNSGPLAGLGEIQLEALQPGSSIMPGKVNPVLPEAAAMVAAQVMGNDAAVAVAGQSGNFELNVMLPVIADNLLGSIGLLAGVTPLLADRCIATFEVRSERLAEALHRNPILVTALNAKIGYLNAAAIAKRAYAEGRPILQVAAEETDLSEAELRELLDPGRLTGG